MPNINLSKYHTIQRNISFKIDQDSLQTYYQEVSNRLLTKEEERELLSLISQGNQEARQILIERNLRLVIHCANKYVGHGIELEDLIQEGNIGLIKALEHFDFSRDTNFSSYAYYWIKRYIIEYIYNNGRTIRLPYHLHTKITKYKKGLSQLTISLGRIPTKEEILNYLEISEQDLNLIITNIPEIISLNSSLSTTDDNNEYYLQQELETFISSDEPSLEDTVIKMTLLKDLKELIEHSELKPRQKEILALRYGLDNNGGRTLEEIAHIFGTSRENINQQENRALQKLRRNDLIANYAIYLDDPSECLEKLLYFKYFQSNQHRIFPTSTMLEHYNKHKKRKLLTK